MAVYFDDRNYVWRECPYNPEHRVAMSRYVFHLTTCPQRNKPDITICPFNAEHRVHVSRLKQHVLECPTARSLTRTAIEEAQRRMRTGSSYRYNMPIKNHGLVLKSDDEWEPKDDQEPLCILGLHKKLSLEEMVELHRKTGVEPSKFMVQGLSKNEKKELRAKISQNLKEHIKSRSTPMLRRSSLSPTSSEASSPESSSCRATSTTSLRSVSFSVETDFGDEDYVPLRRPRYRAGIGRGRILLNLA